MHIYIMLKLNMCRMPRYTFGDNLNPKHSITDQWWGFGLQLRTMIIYNIYIYIYISYTFNVTGSKPGHYSLLLSFVKPAKKQRAIKIKCSQTHFKSVLGHHASYRKKSKKLLKGANLVLQKGTKKSNLFLGSWLAVWVANEICTFIA